MNMFVRVVEGGYDLNGNHLFRVFLYKSFDDAHIKGQFLRVGKDEAKRLVGGRYNPNSGSITTQWDKVEILDHIKANFKGKVGFVFE